MGAPGPAESPACHRTGSYLVSGLIISIGRMASELARSFGDSSVCIAITRHQWVDGFGHRLCAAESGATPFASVHPDEQIV